MTKKEARAILSASTRIQNIVAGCLSQLNEADRNYAEAYWAGAINNIVRGDGWGSMPVHRADVVLSKEVEA